jgi:hypothetical protein
MTGSLPRSKPEEIAMDIYETESTLTINMRVESHPHTDENGDTVFSLIGTVSTDNIVDDKVTHQVIVPQVTGNFRLAVVEVLRQLTQMILDDQNF